MSGSKHPLRTGAKWILDTHIYHQAARQDKAVQKSSSSGDSVEAQPSDSIEDHERRIFQLIVERCPQVYCSFQQWKEIEPQIHREFGRFWQHRFDSLNALDKQKKFVRIRPTRAASEEERALFDGKAHHKIDDDIHLYEAARTAHAEVLVTEDSEQLGHRNRVRLEEMFGVRLYRCGDLLRIAEEERNASEAEERPAWEKELEDGWQQEWGERPK